MKDRKICRQKNRKEKDADARFEHSGIQVPAFFSAFHPRSSDFFLSPLAAAHRGSLELAVGLAPLQVFTLVELRFALADRQRHFHSPVLPIKGERQQCVALHCSQSEQFADLRFMEEQFSDCLGLMILQVAVRILIDVCVIEQHLVIFHARERIADLAFAGAQGLDLRAVQYNAGFKCFQDVVIAPGFGVGKNIGHVRRSGFNL